MIASAAMMIQEKAMIHFRMILLPGLHAYFTLYVYRIQDKYRKITRIESVKILSKKEVNILKDLWFEKDQPCVKRMKEALPEWLMRYQKEHTLKEETVQNLLKSSAATIGRVLSTFKVKGERYGM